MDGEKIFICTHDWQGLDFQNVQTAHAIQQQQQNPIMGRRPKFSKGDIQMANRHMKRDVQCR